MSKRAVLKSVLVIFILSIVFFGLNSIYHPQVSAEEESLDQKVSEIQESFAKLQSRIPNIGFINTDEAVAVFQEVVKEEREEAQQVQQDFLNLQKDFQEDKISKSEFNMQNDVMRAKIMQARIEVYLGMVNEMLEVEGFEKIADRLEKLNQQVKPTLKKLKKLEEGIPKGEVPPQKVTGTLKRAQNQLQQFEEVVMELIRQRIYFIAGEIADEAGYDLLLKQGNIIFREKEGEVKDITSQVKEKIEEEFN